MKIYAIGDLHLGFGENVNKPMGVFGSGWENHEERLKNNWEELVGGDDIVILPGDISWGLKLEDAVADLDWIHDLPGKKVIFKGNHDLWWTGIKRLNSMYDDMYFMQNEAYMVNDEIAIAGARGWITPGSDEFDEHDDKIYKREIMRLEMSLKAAARKGAATIIAAMHYPPAYAGGDATGFSELFAEYGIKYCVYGHLHGAVAFGSGIRGKSGCTYYKLVSLDYLGARPKLIYDGVFID